MKILIASDLHGSARCCRALLEAVRREAADRVVLLGDLLYHGPRNPLPEEYDTQATAAMLSELTGRVLCVRGNCDSEVDQMVLPFPILADSAWLYVEDSAFFLTHGHLQGPDNPPPLAPWQFLVCGHTHLPVLRNLGKFTYLNPGSLSLPKDGTPHSYLTFENGVFTWRDVVTGQAFRPLS